MNDPITFYAHLPEDQLDNLEAAVLKYLPDTRKYLISHEISQVKKISHFHVIVEYENDIWEQFRNAILIKKYKLSAKNKQYGKVKKINDVNKMISYILKDDGPRRTNIEATLINEYLEASYKKSEDKDHIELAIASVPQLAYQYEFSDTDITCKKIMILEYFKKNNLDCNIQKVGRIFNMYLMRHEKFSANMIYEIMKQDRNNRL